MDHHSSGFVASPWAAAVLGHHAMAATAAVAGAAASASASDIGFAAAAAAAHVQNVAHHHSHHHQIAAAATAAAAAHHHHHHGHHHSTHTSHHHPPHHHHHHHSTTAHGHPQHSHMHPHAHHLNPTGMPMDLHVPQGFPYYRYREDALCWGDRKSMEEIGAAQSSVNARILELRKEKSRDAARSRRGKENYEFYELAKMLPLPAAITSQLDKASIIRLTISYLKLRDFSGHGDPPWTREASSSSKLKSAAIRRSPAVDLFEQHQGTHILQSLDGFALAVAADGRFLYISETVSIYLGLSQVEMTGSSIFDYIHQGDHAEIAEQLGLSLTNSGLGSNGSGSGGSGGVGGGGAATVGLASPTSGASDDGIGSHGTNNPDVSAQMTVASTSGYKGYERSFCIRMKSTLTKRGCHFKSSGYRANDVSSVNGGKNGYKPMGTNYSVVLLLCKLRPQYTFSHTRKSQPPLLGMVGLAIALPPPSVHEIRLECDMFVTRINFDFRIAHCEPRVSELLDYTPEDLVGRSMYSLCHAEDSNRLRKSHSDLIEKGQVLTGYFRLMNKNGGYTWLQSCATIVCSTKNADEQNIICVNYVISNREYENLILDCCQLEPTVNNIKHEEVGGDKRSGSGSPNDSGGDPLTDTHTRIGAAGGVGDGGGGGTSAATGGGELDAKTTSPCTDATDGQHHQHHHNQRGRGRGAASSGTTTVTGNSALLKDIPTSLCIDGIDNVTIVSSSTTPASALLLPTAVATPAIALSTTATATSSTTTTTSTTTKRKRKSKAVALQPEENIETSSNTAIVDHQPIAKLPALETQTRTRLPSIVDEQQQQQHHQQASSQSQQQQHSSEASVKDLENAMSKHLPSPGVSTSIQSQQPPSSNPNSTDFSADALLKQHQQQHQHQHHHHHHNQQQQQQHHQQQQQQQQDDKNGSNSTIQWIGAPHYQQPAPMPATALLRQLYANRESVIRATARQTPTGIFYGDQPNNGNGPLPTPPGSENSYDNQYLQLHSVAAVASHPQKGTTDAFTNLVSTYGGYHSSIDYHNAMTPPSSVSPRDSNNALNGGGKATTQHSNGYTDYTDSLRVQYSAPTTTNGSDGAMTPSLPLKPQPYTVTVAAAAAAATVATMHVAHPHAGNVNVSDANNAIAYNNLDQPQYFAPHSSFHLYHKGAPPSTAGWYSTPS